MSTPAAQYLRISRAEQRQSLDVQRSAISAYAHGHGCTVIQTYVDTGRTGLVLKERPGLQQLLRDVVSGSAKYRSILVYDISRWGRFQDTDEAAHYEFLCKSAGISVVYCNEELVNEDGPISHIMKTLARSMAAEYSRDLGIKVFAGQSKLSSLGFRMGAAPGYGLRRMLITCDGREKGLLAAGQTKDLITDRVVLVPGPLQEVECVRGMYADVLRGLNTADIQRRLQQSGPQRPDGRPWTYEYVRQILRHPKYMGCAVWGRTSGKLHQSRTKVPASQWMTREGALRPLVDARTYHAVQAVLSHSRVYNHADQLLNSLRRLLERHGKLSQKIIGADRASPAASCYHRWFGSLRRAYELIGYRPSSDYIRRRARAKITRSVRHAVVAEIEQRFRGRIAAFAERDPRRQPRLLVDDELLVAVTICRCLRGQSHRHKWVLDPVARNRSLPNLVCLLNPRNDGVQRFYLFDKIERVGRLRFGLDHPWLATGRQVDSISGFYREAVRLIRPKPMLLL